MKIKLKNKLNKLILLIIIFYLTSYLNNVNLKADIDNYQNQLIIDAPDIINEDTNFEVSVYTLINNSPNYQINTIIIFDNKTYNITYVNPEIIIKSPIVKKDTLFQIIAKKDGYIDDNKFIMILNEIEQNKSKLIITILENDFLIEGNTYFDILITDEEGFPIVNVTVGIQNYFSDDKIDITNKTGRARLLSPNNSDEIIILAQKKGFYNSTKLLFINRDLSLIDRIIESPYILIFFSLFILIFSIFVVKIKNKKIKKNNNKKTTDNNEKLGCPNKIKNNNELKTIKESKIEEIRISKNTSNNKIIDINNKKNEQNKKYNLNDKVVHRIDEIHYKVDILTNKDNVEKKWFEGKDQIKNKIDIKLKKNKK
jgi:hypothetical protein